MLVLVLVLLPPILLLRSESAAGSFQDRLESSDRGPPCRLVSFLGVSLCGALWVTAPT